MAGPHPFLGKNYSSVFKQYSFTNAKLMINKNFKNFSSNVGSPRGAWQDHTHFLAKIKVGYFYKQFSPSSSLESIKISIIFSAMLGHPEGSARATHTHYLAKIKVGYFYKQFSPSSSLESIKISIIFSAMLGHPEGSGKATHTHYLAKINVWYGIFTKFFTVKKLMINQIFQNFSSDVWPP